MCGRWRSGKTVGPEAPNLGTGLNNLALLYTDQGQYAKAEPLYRRTLAIYEKALDPEHPNVANNLENYALYLRQMGRPEEAALLEARVRAIRAKIRNPGGEPGR
jgi:tetratricopeptide (TPR) repeat protein